MQIRLIICTMSVIQFSNTNIKNRLSRLYAKSKCDILFRLKIFAYFANKTLMVKKTLTLFYLMNYNLKFKKYERREIISYYQRSKMHLGTDVASRQRLLEILK